MEKLTVNNIIFKFDYRGKKYYISEKLVAFYLSRYFMSKAKPNSIKEADRLFWRYYKKYLDHPQLCENDSKIHIDYILSSYLRYK
jgi:hypothetical protein